MAVGQVFSEYFGFLCQFIPPTAPHSSCVFWGWYNGQLVADVLSRLRLTPPEETKEKVFIIVL
jgi:hypothetical protein